MEDESMARKPMGYWTEERLTEEAAKYQYPSDLAKGSPNAYVAAKKLGRAEYERITAHMERKYKPNGYWTPEALEAEAAKYQFRGDFANGNPNAYNAARALGEEECERITAHMERKRTDWTLDRIEDEAAKYRFPSDFKKGGSSAYNAALKLGKAEYERITAHMERSTAATDADRLYVELIPDPEAHTATPMECDESLLKVGITGQKRPDEARQNEWARVNSMDRETVRIIDTHEARALEVLLHGHHLTRPAEMLDHVLDGKTEFVIVRDADIKVLIEDAIALAA
jgi:hypothetical protein